MAKRKRKRNKLPKELTAAKSHTAESEVGGEGGAGEAASAGGESAESPAESPSGEGASGAPVQLPGPLERLRKELRQPTFACGLLVALCVLLYANSVRVPFLFDDTPVITQNRLLWEWKNLPELLTTRPLRSLTNLTFFVNFQLARTPTAQPDGGYDWRHTWSYHVVSIVLHALNACLLYLLLRALLQARDQEVPPGTAPWVALGGALLWAVHPAHTMAVTYIAQRYALLGTTAFVGTVLLYVRTRLRLEARQGPMQGGDLLRILGVLAASLTCGLTKQNAAVIPAALVLVELLMFRRKTPLVVAPVLAAFAVGGALAMAKLGVQAFFPERTPTADRWEYFTTQITVVIQYLRQFVCPVQLSVEQNYPFHWDTKLRDSLVALAAHWLLVVLAVKLAWRGLRLIPLAIGWFYVTMVVESSFIPILDAMVDHRMYLPTALLGAGLAAGLARAWPWVRRAGLGGLTLAAWLGVCATFGVGTVVRNVTWSSPIGIWEDTIAKRPSCARAYSSLGMEHLYQGHWMEAIAPIEAALDLGALHVEGWNNAGKAYLELEQWHLAEQALRKGIQVNQVAPSPNAPLCWNNLGLVYMRVAALPDAGLLRYVDLMAVFRSLEAAGIDPKTNVNEARRFLFREATRLLDQAVKLNPYYEVAYLNLTTSQAQLVAWLTADTERAERQQRAEACLVAAERAGQIAQARKGALPRSVYRHQALAYTALAQYDEAFGIYQQFAQQRGSLPPSELEAILGEACQAALQLHDGLTDKSEATPYFRLAYGMGEGVQPSTPIVAAQLCQVAIELNELERGQALLDQLNSRLGPDHPYVKQLSTRMLIRRSQQPRGE